jgi:hypothetical protein
MATLAVTNDFSAGDAIVASEMNTNFTDIETFINTTPGVLQITGGTVTGAVTLSNTLTVGANDVGYDVKFFGATATNGYMLWDESEDDLVFGSAVKVGVGITGPVTALEVASDNDLTDFTSANRGMFTLSNTDHATDDIVAMDFRYRIDSDEEPSARIGAKMGSGGSSLILGTSNDYAGITNEALTIDPSGDVALAGGLTVGGYPVTGGWTAWTPTLTNWGIGNGSFDAEYVRIGKTCFVHMKFIVGATTTYSSYPIFTMPFDCTPTGAGMMMAEVKDSGGGTRKQCVASFIGGSDDRVLPYWVSNATANYTPVTETVPFTFSGGEQIRIQGFYEVD